MENVKDITNRPVHIGALLFDGYELLDVYGPLELFGTCNTVKNGTPNVSTVSAETSKKCTASEGPVTLTDYCIHDSNLPEFDIIFIPGGFGTRKLQADPAYIEKLTSICNDAKLVMTVCTGSMLLAKTGLLDGVTATTNKAAFLLIKETYPNVNWMASARWCEDGKFLTSSGVSAGSDLANYLITGIYGEKVAKLACKLAEYTPATNASDDPFAAELDVVAAPSLPSSMVNQQQEVLTLGYILYDNFEMLDTFGPLECFGMVNKIFKRQQNNDIDTPLGFRVITIAESKVVKSNKGPSFEVDMTFEEWSMQGGIQTNPFHILFIPGGIGTLREIHNPKMKSFLGQVIPIARKVMTVCTGSTILGAHGFLDGKKATSNKLAFNLLAMHATDTEWVKNARWIIDGKFYTSSGVAAGTDLSLFLIKELFGDQVTKEVVKLAEYQWNDDATHDPFADTIPENTLMHRIGNSIQKNLIALVFRVGFSLTSSDMLFFTRLISE